MAHGWNTDHDSETRSGSEALSVSLESEESFEQRIDQHTDEDNLSSMVVSETLPTSNCLRAEANSLQTTCHEPPWQEGGKLVESTGGQSEDIKTDLPDITKNESSVLIADSIGKELNSGLLAGLDSYSDVSSCSEADFECPSNDVNEEKPDLSLECQKMESVKERNELEKDTSTFLHTDSLPNTLEAGGEETANTTDSDKRETQESDCETTSSCLNNVKVIDDGSLQERSPSDTQDQSLNISSTEGENVCILKSDEHMTNTCLSLNTKCSVEEEHRKDQTGSSLNTECSAEELFEDRTAPTLNAECNAEEQRKDQTAPTLTAECNAEEQRKDQTALTLTAECNAEEQRKDQSAPTLNAKCNAQEYRKDTTIPTLNTECTDLKGRTAPTQKTESSVEEHMKDKTGPTLNTEWNAEEHMKDGTGPTQNTGCSMEESNKDLKETLTALNSSVCDMNSSSKNKLEKKTDINGDDKCNQSDCEFEEVNRTCDSSDTEKPDVNNTPQTEQTEGHCSSNDQEVQRSSFEFLQSCFGLKTEHNPPFSNSPVPTTLDQHERQSSVHEDINQTSLKCDTDFQSPDFLKPTFVTVNEVNEVRSDADSLQEPPLLSDRCKAQASSEQKNDCTEGQIISGLEVETNIIREVSLVSSQKLMNKLQPVVLLQTSEIEADDGNIYRCCACKKSSQTLDELIEHHHCEHSQCNFQCCVTCERYFSSDALAEQHVCGQFPPNHLQLHNSVSHNEQSEKGVANFKCRYCLKPFIMRHYYLNHVHRHRTVTKYRCGCCGLYFPDESKLSSHKRKVRCSPLVLEPVQSKESSGINLKRPIKPTAILEVDGCQIYDCFVKVFDINERDLSSQKIKCPVCEKIFRLRAQLNAHVRSHSEEKPFKCDKCQKDFKYLWNLNKHKREQCSQKRRHSLPVPARNADVFPCPLCPREFKHSYNTIRHMREQCLKVYIRKGKGKVGGRYKCPLCTDTFSMASNRSRHVKKTCFKRFKANWLANRKKTKANTSDSSREVKDENLTQTTRFGCKFCPATFSHKPSVWKHTKKKHELRKNTSKPVGKNVNISDLKQSSSNDQGPDSPKSSREVSSQHFTCHFCERCFNSPERLRKHIRLHVGKKPFRCLDCGKNFERRGHLIAHKNVHKRRIQCSVCKRILPSIGDLLKHRQSHKKKGVLQCPDCQLQFKFPVHFLRHVASHTKSESKSVKSPPENQAEAEDERTKEIHEVFNCGICHKKFGNFKAMSEHCLTHIPKGLVSKCPICKRHFPNPTRAVIVRHMRLHTGEKPFLCKDCGIRFGRMEYLKTHEEKCPGPEKQSVVQEKKLNCSYCPHTFSFSSSLKLHERAHMAKSLLPCSNCGKYYKKKNIKKHVKNCKGNESQRKISRKKNKNENKHRDLDVIQSDSKEIGTKKKKKPQESCPHCPKRFPYRCYLLRHLRSHFRTKTFACMYCGRKYDSEKLYLQHEAFCKNLLKEETKAPSGDSSNEGVLKCSFCTKSFTKPRSLRRHILTHTDVKPYRCKACEKSFSRFDHLKRHQAVCKGKKPQLEVRIEKINLELLGTDLQTKVQEPSDAFQCNVCFKTLCTQSSLTRHMALLHSTDSPFICKRCGKEYSSLSTLRRHTRTVKCKRSSGESLKEPVSNTPTEPRRETSKLQRIRSHYSNKFQFHCEYCPRHFKSQATLITHTRLHTGEKPFVCDSCGEGFIRRDYLQRHTEKCIKNAIKVGSLQKVLCKWCCGSYTQGSLHKHQKKCMVKFKSRASTQATSTSEAKGFSCVQCSERFLLFSQLQQHLLNKHRSEGLQPLENTENQQCDVKAHPVEEGNIKSLPSSSQVHEKAKPFECSYCKLKFINSSGLAMHVRTHTAQYPFSCGKCSKGFWSKIVLQKHKRRCKRLEGLPNKDPNLEDATTLESELNDTVLVIKKSSKSNGTGVLQTKFSCKDNEKDVVHKYQCSECDQSFTDGLRLISHLEDHGREDLESRLSKRVRCKLCGKAFGNAGRLQRHMRTQHHEKKLPTTCPQCFRIFRCSADMALHRSYHDPNRPFVCDTCTLRFWTAKALRVHECVSHLDTGAGKAKESSKERSAKVFTCEPCNTSYASRKSYWRHCKIKHQESSKSHKAESAPKDQDLVNKESDASVSGNEDESGDDSDSAPYFPCHVCGKTFVTSESLEDHQRCHLGEKPYECEECGKCFFQLLNLQQHQRSHKTEFQCSLCGKGFISLFALRKHKHTHGKRRPHRCTKCHLSFTGSSQLAEHMLTHREENFPCDLCDETFTCKSSRAEHRKTHTRKEEELPPLISPAKQISPPTPPPPSLPPPPPPPPKSRSRSQMSLDFQYHCQICLLRFRDPEQLSEHGCHPSLERPYSCPECDKHFLHGSHLKKHQLCHQMPGVRSFKCTSCHMQFRHQHQCLSHMKQHGNEPSVSEIKQKETLSDTSNLDLDKIYKCPICPERFAQALELADHLSVHSHMCSVCKKTFPTKQKLEEHEHCHVAAATQYECTECGNSFLGSDSFRQHNCARQKRSFSDAHHGHSSRSPPRKKRSTGASNKFEVEEVDEEEEVDVGEDFYNCPVCNKRFSSSNSLQDHQKLHEDLRPFKCLVCGKGFAKKKYLVQHQHLHKETPYQCEFCTESFKTETQHKSHRRTHNEALTQCSVCSKSYRTPSELARHAKKHPQLQNSEESSGNYRCDMCYKSFSSLSRLEKHQETHVGQVVYECTECDKAFAFLNLLEEHQQIHAAAIGVSQSSAHIFFQNPVHE